MAVYRKKRKTRDPHSHDRQSQGLSGHVYDYDLRKLQRAEPIPPWLARLSGSIMVDEVHGMDSSVF